MENLEKSLATLDIFRKESAWLIFFNRVERLRQLEIQISEKNFTNLRHANYLNWEAVTKRKYLGSNRQHYVALTKNLEQTQAVIDILDKINANVWFGSSDVAQHLSN